MRVPDLDWPEDLFTDAAIADDREATDRAPWLCPAMRDAGTRNGPTMEPLHLAA